MDHRMQKLCDAAVILHPAARAEVLVPESPGLYSIFVDDAAALPLRFSTILQQRETKLIYCGMASTSLRERLVDQDLRHRAPSSFFRSLGAVLGFRPAFGSLRGMKNQCNYTFTRTDTARIVEWINAHLGVRILPATIDCLEWFERGTIQELKPILNIQNNPERVPELLALRAECLRIARGEGPAPHR